MLRNRAKNLVTLAIFSIVFASLFSIKTAISKTVTKSNFDITHTKGNVRVTLLGISSGLTYRKTHGSTVTSDFGNEPCQYLRVFFLVEKLGKAEGKSLKGDIYGPEGKIKTYQSEWGNVACDTFERLSEMERLPELSKETIEASVFKHIHFIKHQKLPENLSISVQYFGETFWFNVEMP